MELIYLVAGLSRRFLGKIKAFSKIGPNGETLIEYSLNQALSSGFTKIIFVVGEQTEKSFKKKFGNSYKGIPIEYVLQKYDSSQRDKPWGTCDALCSAIYLIKEPFVLCSGDEIYGEKTFEILTNHLKTQDCEATSVKKLIEMIPEKGIVNRGTFEINENNYVIEAKENLGLTKENFQEKGLTPEDPTNTSIFAMHPKTLYLLKEKLKEFKEKNQQDRKTECYLNIELVNLIKQGKIKIKLYYTSEKWFGITNPEDEEEVRKLLKNLHKTNL